MNEDDVWMEEWRWPASGCQRRSSAKFGPGRKRDYLVGGGGAAALALTDVVEVAETEGAAAAAASHHDHGQHPDPPVARARVVVSGPAGRGDPEISLFLSSRGPT